MDLKLVIFDMDGVVFYSEKVYFEANKRAADELGMKNYTLDYYKQFLGAGTDEMLRKMALDYGNEELIKEFYRLSVKNVLPIVDAGGLKLKSGFLELTDYLRENKIQAVLASSNYRKDIKYYLKKANITDRFSHIISADDVTKAKPAPDIFLKAWQKADAPAKSQTLVIEDSKNGIKAANNAEIPVVMVPDILEPTEYEKTHTIAIKPGLMDVKNLIAKN